MNALLPILGILICLQAQATEVCDKATTTPEMNRCLEAEHQKEDIKLNAAYRAALQYIETRVDDSQQLKDTRQGFVEAQRLWMQFRDKDCGAVYNLWRGGTIRGVMFWGCMIARTESRTKELETLAYQQY